jgi:hypothetical protein
MLAPAIILQSSIVQQMRRANCSTREESGLVFCNSSIFSPALVVKSVDLHPGDLVAFSSDGITEAMAPANPGNEEIRIMKSLKSMD